MFFKEGTPVGPPRSYPRWGAYYIFIASKRWTSGVDALAQGATTVGHQQIVAELNEEDDDRSSNQFVWDLWSLADGDFVPAAMQDYYLYGVIDDGTLRRLARMGGLTPRPLKFEHPPSLLPLQPAPPQTHAAIVMYYIRCAGLYTMTKGIKK